MKMILAIGNRQIFCLWTQQKAKANSQNKAQWLINGSRIRKNNRLIRKKVQRRFKINKKAILVKVYQFNLRISSDENRDLKRKLINIAKKTFK